MAAVERKMPLHIAVTLAGEPDWSLLANTSTACVIRCQTVKVLGEELNSSLQVIYNASAAPVSEKYFAGASIFRIWPANMLNTSPKNQITIYQFRNVIGFRFMFITFSGVLWRCERRLESLLFEGAE